MMDIELLPIVLSEKDLAFIEDMEMLRRMAAEFLDKELGVPIDVMGFRFPSSADSATQIQEASEWQK